MRTILPSDRSIRYPLSLVIERSNGHLFLIFMTLHNWVSCSGIGQASGIPGETRLKSGWRSHTKLG